MHRTSRSIMRTSKVASASMRIDDLPELAPALNTGMSPMSPTTSRCGDLYMAWTVASVVVGAVCDQRTVNWCCMPSSAWRVPSAFRMKHRRP